MRLLFIVQGEGRGHLTQAISLAQLLQAAGHEVLGAWVNVAEGRPVPPFFTEQFNAPITAVAGPLLVYNTHSNALDLGATIWGIVKNSLVYRRSINQLQNAIIAQKPDLVINIFELLGGLTYGIHRPAVPMVCIGHQCLAFHPSFPFSSGKWLDRLLFKALVRLNAWGATELFGLSFDRQNDVPRHRLRVMPPLLRGELTGRDPVTRKTNACPYVLAYTTQPGLLREVLKAHRQRPDVILHYFNADVTESEERINHTLYFHRIDGTRYLDYMQSCQAVLTTAGFESVCEALYLGKPVLMMPQPNHYEQACNALDGERAGALQAATAFELNTLMNHLTRHDETASNRFRNWYDTGRFHYVQALQRVALVNP